jgi:hypothetical protein
MEIAVEPWPSLPLADWLETRDTVHRWTQMIGKVKLARCPFVNQWWEVGLSLTSRGLSSGPIPAADRSFEISLDVVEARLRILASDGTGRSLTLKPRTVADFYGELRAALGDLGLATEINPVPSELPDPIAFDQDTEHAAYDHDAVRRWWTAMLSVERAIQRFRTEFTGKSSPVLFYWGGFDLNHTRYNGVPVAQPADANPIRRYGENEQNFAVGFWPGSREAPEPVLYAYVSPTPEGMADVTPSSPDARFLPPSGEFVLPYELVRRAPDPEAATIAFFSDIYRRSTDLAGWDRPRLRGPAPDLRSGSTASGPQPHQEPTT